MCQKQVSFIDNTRQYGGQMLAMTLKDGTPRDDTKGWDSSR